MITFTTEQLIPVLRTHLRLWFYEWRHHDPNFAANLAHSLKGGELSVMGKFTYLLIATYLMRELMLANGCENTDENLDAALAQFEKARHDDSIVAKL